MLRIDSIAFLGVATLLVAVMRVLPVAGARLTYALTSLVVYVWLSPDLLSLGGTLAFVYWPFLVLRGRRPVAGFWVGAVVCLQTILFVWARKYLTVFPSLAGSGLLNHALAIVGVSYIVLKQVELILWVDAEPDTEVGFVDYTAFLLGLFTLLAGPIFTYRDFQAAFSSRLKDDPDELTSTLNRIVNGYIKVSLIGPFLYDLTSLGSLAKWEYGTGAKLAFFYLYPIYIYLNFSGYCDVVIGLGRLAHLKIPENFAQPFLATNIQNYWQRWHITFSTWIRVHLFFPLVRGLRSLGAFASPAAIFITFLVVGLWHGTDPGFAVFGILHGLAIVAVGPYESLLRRALGDDGLHAYQTNRWLKPVRIGVCYHYLCLTLVFFERPLVEVLKWVE